MDKLLALARTSVREMKAYSSARSEDDTALIQLDANESPWAPYPGGVDGEGLNRYPEPQPKALLKTLGALYGVPAESLFVGRGSDDAIDALVRTFCEAGVDEILITPPTYGVYGVAAALQGAGIREVPLRPETFATDPAGVAAAAGGKVKLVFLCSPNNPTGNTVPPDTVLELCRALADKAIVILDEAYIEFSKTASLAPRAGEIKNLVVLRTLSKAYALAGARCGTAIAHPGIIALLQKVRAPYPLSLPSIRLVLEALTADGQRLAAERIEIIKAERERLSRALAASKQVGKIFPSEANFILARMKDSPALLQACLSRGIRIRDRGTQHTLAGCVRISVGSPEDNRRFLDVLERAAGTERPI